MSFAAGLVIGIIIGAILGIFGLIAYCVLAIGGTVDPPDPHL